MVEETLAAMIAPARSALVVVDVQVDFCARDGALGMAGVDLATIDPAVDRIAALLAAARGAGVAVCFTRVVTTPETDGAAVRTWYARRGMAGGEAICRAGSRGADLYRVVPRPGEITVAKRLFDAFHETDLDAQLRARGIDTLVMTGVTTDCCVDGTARGGFHRGYHIFVVPDACAAYEPGLHDGPLDALAKSCALLAPSGAVMDAWAGAMPR